MPRTNIPITSLKSHSSIEFSYTAGDAANDHSFVNTGKELLYVKNGAIAVVTDVKGVTDANKRTGDTSRTVGALKESVFGPFPPHLYNQSDGTVNVDIDDDSNVELAVVRLDP